MWTGIRGMETVCWSPSGGDTNMAGHFVGKGLSGGVLSDDGVSAFTFNGKTLKGLAGNTFTPIRLNTQITNSPGGKPYGFLSIRE